MNYGRKLTQLVSTILLLSLCSSPLLAQTIWRSFSTPVTTPILTGTIGSNGWYRSNVQVTINPNNVYIVDHNNYLYCDNADLTNMQQIGTQRIYFTHASVGWNILSGLSSLNSLNSSRFPLQIADAGASPPSVTTGGTIYQYDRGNPGASAKITSFATYVGNGWYYPSVDIAMNKFCFIDTDADFSEYISSMTSLESAYPSTTFIYVTIPICLNDNYNNITRYNFNQQLRTWAQTNHKYLYDIADIEAYDPLGNAITFTESGEIYPEMYSGYTSDGGHLNDAGSLVVAKGLYSLFEDILSKVTNTYYQIDTGTPHGYTTSFTISGEAQHTLYYYSVDKAGNTEATKSTQVKIDTSAPSTIETGVTEGSTITGSANITLGATDNVSGVAGIYYTIDGGSQQLYSSPIVISASGAHTISYWATDNAGNVESAHSLSFTLTNGGNPVITSLSPSIVSGAKTFTLTVNGTNFVSGSIIKFNGTNMTTTYVSATQLTASINKYYTTLSSYPGSATVTVLNPGGSRSAGVTLSITKPIPLITSLSPSSVPGKKTFTLTVSGSNFVSGSIIKFNGTNMTTTFVSSTQLTASINMYYTTLSSYPGSATISVLNPDGGRSTGATLTITVPVMPPTITSLSPDSITGATTFTLTVNGTDFQSGAVIKWNGTNMTTTYVSPTQITATINKYYDTLTSYPGSATISVLNPDGGRSTGATLTITTP